MLTQVPDQPVKHPPSITGAKCQTSLSVSVDYLRVILPIFRSEYTLEALDLLFKDYLSLALNFSENIPYCCGRKFAHGHRSFDNTCILGYNWNTEDTGEAIITISGSSLARLSLDRMHSFFKDLHSLAARCTRIDIALDDFTKSYFNYERLQETVQAGNFTGARPESYSCKLDGNAGWLVTIGKRSNSVFRRFYNKSVESKGQIDSNRFETEYKHEHSRTIYDSICTLDLDSVLDFISKLICGSVDFIDRSLGVRAARCPRLPWWEDFINIMGGVICWSVPRLVRTIEKTIKWVEKQVSSSLAVISECKGIHWFKNWLEKSIDVGHRRFKSSHLNRIENHFLEKRYTPT